MTRNMFAVGPIPAIFVLLWGVVVVLLSTSPPVAGWTTEELHYFDDMRDKSATVFTEKTKRDSAVIEVMNVHDGEKLRLCQVSTILPVTNGDLKPQNEYGLYASASALLAMLHFNHKIASVVPELETDPVLKDCNVRLTMESIDSEFSPIVANARLIEDILTRKHNLQTPRPIFVKGACRSAVSAPLSMFASINSLPVVSSASTSSQLDNKGVYGYFGRAVPSDAGIAVAAATYLREVLDVSHCGVIFIKDEFGNAYHEEFTRAAFAMDPPMVVESASFTDSGGQQSMRDALEKLKATGYRYFFAIVLPYHHETLAELAGSQNVGLMVPGNFWLLSDGGQKLLSENHAYDQETEKHLARASNGVGVMNIEIVPNEGFEAAWEELTTDPALNEYFWEMQPQDKNFSEFTGFVPNPGSFEYFAYDSVMAMGIGACRAQNDYFTGRELFDEFRKVTFEGASGFVSFNEDTGSRDFRKMAYKVYNVLADRLTDDSRIAFTATEVAKQVPSVVSDPSSSKVWLTTATPTYADGTTIAPLSIPPIQIDHNLISSGVLAFGLVLCGLALLMSLCWLVWTWFYRERIVVEISQPVFLAMLALGSFVMASSIIPASLQEPYSQKSLDSACASVWWLFQTGFVISFSALFSKVARMMRLFHGGRGFRTINRIQHIEMAAPLLTLFSISAVILTTWMIVSPPEWERVFTSSLDQYGRSVESYGHCTSKNHGWFLAALIGLDIGILFMASVETYRARHVSSAYNELFYISVSVASILQAFMIGVPVIIVTETNPTASFVSQSILISLICGAVLLPIFLPKDKARREFDEQAEQQRSWKELLHSQAEKNKGSGNCKAGNVHARIAANTAKTNTKTSMEDILRQELGDSFIYQAHSRVSLPDRETLHVIVEMSALERGSSKMPGNSGAEGGSSRNLTTNSIEAEPESAIRSVVDSVAEHPAERSMSMGSMA